MSTAVDVARSGKSKRTPASVTKARVQEAAARLFCKNGYDQVGIRDVAVAGGVDPAMVMRLFGSKEGLFVTIAEAAFRLDLPITVPIDGIGFRIAAYLVQDQEHKAADFDQFEFLLRSAPSLIAGPILSKALHRTFILPLMQMVDRPDAEARATVVTSIVLGFLTLRKGLGPPAYQEFEGLRDALGKALQACLA